MKIEVNKNELERALIALGKLISRMSPIPEHKSLLIECKDGKVCFIMLMFLPGTLPDCNIRRIISCPFTVLNEALLKLTEEFVVIRMPVALGESDIISHEEGFTVTVTHVGHDLINLLQYRLFASKLLGFIRHDGMSLVLVFVGDSFVSHVAVFLLLLFCFGYWLFCFSLCRDEPPVMSEALTGAYIGTTN